MKALSIRQPWAWLIVHGIKDIENRTWRTKFRGKIYIHAPQKIDLKAYEHITHGLPTPDKLKTGGIIGASEIVDCIDESDSKWFAGPFGFKLINSSPLPFMPCLGRLYFFRPDLP